MAFYVGDQGKIGGAYSSGVAVPLWRHPFVVAAADFSLHLSPVDLDLLSEEACRLVGAPPGTLTDSLTDRVGGDGQTSSAEVVSPRWVGAVAGIPDRHVEELARRWLARVAQEHSEQAEGPTEDAVRAIRELIRACRVATERGLPVVHTWCL
jgi:hypothetical protein